MGKEISFSLFRVRDVIVFGLVITAILHCYYQPISYEYSIEPIWFVETFDTAAAETANAKQSDLLQRAVPPVVIDIDRDNVKDLISVGFDNIIRISRIGMDVPPSPSHVIHAEEFLRKCFATAAATPMTSTTTDSSDRASPEPSDVSKQIIIALGAGCCYRRERQTADHPQSLDSEANENDLSLENLVVVVNKELRVILMDASLMTLWEADLFQSTQQESITKCNFRATVRILPRYPAKIGQPPQNEADDADITVVLVALQAEESSEACPVQFQMKALNAQNGLTLWEHQEGKKIVPSTPTDAEDEQTKKQKSPTAFSFSHLRFANHPYYDHVQELLRSHTEVNGPKSNDWSDFRSSFMHQLPHYWRNSQDNRLLFAHFSRGKLLLHKSHGSGEQQTTSISTARTGRTEQRRKGTPGDGGAVSSVSELVDGGRKNSKSKSATSSRSSRSKKRAKTVLNLQLPSFSDSNRNVSSLPILHQYRAHSAVSNVAVFHSREGIRVITLQTGQLLADLPLQKNVYYGDINRDGNLDSLYFDTDYLITREIAETKERLIIHAVSDTIRREQQHSNASEATGNNEQRVQEKDMCSFVVLSGFPPHSWLFNDSQLCVGENSYRRYSSKSKAPQRKAANKANPVVLSVPLIVKLPNFHHSPHFQSAINEGDSDQRDLHSKSLGLLYGQDTTGKEIFSSEVASYKQTALIIGNNLGLLNAFNRFGNLLWQQTETTTPHREADYYEKLAPSDRKGPAHPIVMQMSPINSASLLPTAGPAFSADHLLYCFHKKIRIHSLREGDRGRLLLETSLPNPIIHPPLIVDFDENGVNDLIVMTDVAVLGYRIQVHPTFFPLAIPFFVLLMIAAIIFVLKVSSESTSSSASSNSRSSESDNGSAGFESINIAGRSGLPKRKKVWTLTRATDSQHLD